MFHFRATVLKKKINLSLPILVLTHTDTCVYILHCAVVLFVPSETDGLAYVPLPDCLFGRSTVKHTLTNTEPKA